MNLLKPRVCIGDKKYVIEGLIAEGAYAFVYKVKLASLHVPGPLTLSRALIPPSQRTLDTDRL